MTPAFVSFVLVLLVSDGVSGQTPAPDVKKGFELQFKSSPEELEDVPMYFSGSAPSWLDGTLVRGGPGLFEMGDDSEVTSTLDGLAKVAMWNFLGRNNTILFTTKFIRSTYYNESLASGKFTSNIFWTPPRPRLTPAEVHRSIEVGIDNMDINIIKIADRQPDTVHYVATNDILAGYELSLADLSTLGKWKPHQLSVSGSEPEFLTRLATAHPLPEPNTDNLINVVIQASMTPQAANVLKVVRINSTAEVEEIASFEISEVPLLHSFCLAETKVVIVMNPYIMNVTCRVLNEDNCYTWKEGNESTIVYVVDIETGSVQQMSIPKIFVYHHINCLKLLPNALNVDVAGYQSPIPHTKFELARLKDPLERSFMDPRADMKRIFISLDTGTASIISISSPNPVSQLASTLDYPVINEKHRSREYCYAYGIIEKYDDVNIEAVAVAKKDLCGEGRDAIYSRPNWYPSEPTFVPAPDAKGEDHGVLLVPYTSGDTNRTNLVVLNAKNLEFIDMAEGPNHIPQSQHGVYFHSIKKPKGASGSDS